MYSRNWGGLETGSLGMAESGDVVERCEGLGCRELGRDWSGVMGWRVGGLYGNPRPVRLELDPFTSSSCRQTRVSSFPVRSHGFVWQEDKSFCGPLLAWF